MDDADFEGTLVLERLAAIDKIDEFFEAIDADDVERATQLMKRADVDAATIVIVVKKMEAADGEHRARRRRPGIRGPRGGWSEGEAAGLHRQSHASRAGLGGTSW